MRIASLVFVVAVVAASCGGAEDDLCFGGMCGGSSAKGETPSGGLEQLDCFEACKQWGDPKYLYAKVRPLMLTRCNYCWMKCESSNCYRAKYRCDPAAGIHCDDINAGGFCNFERISDPQLFDKSCSKREQHSGVANLGF